jgi:hypothetical protein
MDSTGNFFGHDILTGAAFGAVGGALIGGLASNNWRGALIGAGTGAAFGAAAGYWTTLQRQGRDQAELMSRVRTDLVRENAEIDRTQIAFDALADCRFQQAQAIRTAYDRGVLPRDTALAQMELVRARSHRDIQLAGMINGEIAKRGAQFEVAAENLSPGTQKAIEATRSAPRREAVTRSPTRITLRPNIASPNLASLRAQERVRVVAMRGSYAVVERGSGERGYAPLADLNDTVPGPAESQATGDPVRTLAGSNAARRDAFAASVAVTEQAAARQFELAT